MLAEYGQWDPTLGTPMANADYLMDSYIRRMRWAWTQQGIATINALAKAMGGEKAAKGGDPLLHLRRLGVKVPEG